MCWVFDLSLIFLLTLWFSFFDPTLLLVSLIFFLLTVVLVLVFVVYSYFYSYLMFLLFFSGLLVILMYVCSIILNEKSLFKIKFSLYFLFVCGLVTFNLGEFDFLIYSWLVYFEFYNFIKFYLFSYSLISVFFVFFLFFCLVIVYEIVKKSSGPLRMKF